MSFIQLFMASAAALTALRQSSRVPKLTSAMVSSVAGLMTASFLPEEESHHRPSMKSWRFLTGTAGELAVAAAMTVTSG